jgi:hypothetical protein
MNFIITAFNYFYKRSNFRTKQLCVFVLAILTLLSIPLMDFANDLLTPTEIFNFPNYKEPTHIHLPAIRKLCNETTWHPDLYINCHQIVMGAFNAVNKLEVCSHFLFYKNCA